MKKLLLCVTALLCSIAAAQVQPPAPAQGNLDGNLYANGYGGWSVPQGNAGTFSWTSPTFCTANYGGTSFPAFTQGTPITIIDQITPAHNENVTVTSVNVTEQQCSISTTTPLYLHTQFSLKSATAGLQEAISANLQTTAPLTVHLTADWFRSGGTLGMVTSTITGNAYIGIVDDTKTPTGWYQWNGTNYVAVLVTGTAGQLGTLQGDLVANNGTNTGAYDLNVFIGNAAAAGNSVYTPQQAVTAAAAHAGSVVLQPGALRTPFTNPGNTRVQDNRSDVPATARSVVEDGAQCDTRQVYGILTSGSTTLTIQNGALTSADVGRSIVAVGTTAGGTRTQFESVLVSITDSLHAVMTTASPFNQPVYHEITLGHDDTANIAHTMSVVGNGGTLVFPAGFCMTHTQTLIGQSPIGLGISSQIVGMPGEDIFAAPDPSLAQGVSQGASHIHDLTFLVDSRIDATLPWQVVNDSGTTAKPAMYRPVATVSGVSNTPTAPGWFVGTGTSGAINGVANVTAASAVMCVPSTETAPAVGQSVVFPYLASVFTTTVASTAGSCSGGATPRTLSAAMPAGSTNTQAEWFAGSVPQNLSTSISSGACPSTITLANPINPVAGYESNVAPFGLIQIDAEQFTYFGKSTAANPTPANTLYGVQCAQNGTARAAHSSAATVVPLNQFKPSYPWPVIPTLNPSDTTPAGTAGYFPGWNVGNAAFAFPVASGITPTGAGGWSPNARIENLSFYQWPNEINGLAWGEVNHTAMMYMVLPSYASVFSNLFTLYLFYGIAEGAPSIENGNYATAQPTADGSHWDGITLYAANPVIMSVGNQNSFANFNVYSQEGTTAGVGIGADTCMYFTALHNDQNGGYFDVLSLDHFKNMYCEPEGGAHAVTMPEWEWDTYNSEIEDQHMGGGGEVYIGGAQQHWIGGNFNNAINTPAIVWGTQNTAEYVTNLGSEPKGNVYSVNSLINFGWGNDFKGTTSQRFSSPTGPYGALQVGGRRAMPSQTGETFNTGNLTAPYTSSDAGFISPEEFNANFAFESQAMSVGWTFDDTSPITHSYAACNVGNNPGSIYCATGQFNLETMPIGKDQRLAPGKYTMYVSLKDAVVATNTATFSIFSNCASFQNIYNIPITNAWPTTAAGVFTASVDFSALTAGNCTLGVRFWGATTADQIQIGYLDFAPVAEALNAQTINVTNINTPGGGTGGNANGCASSPVTGIKGGYTCPTKGWATTLTANQGISDQTVTLTSTSGLSSAGCFFVDGEYECYTSITDGTHLGGISRGAYTTTAATHNSGAPAVSINLVLGSIQQTPADVIAYGATEPPILGINNPTPANHGGISVLAINSGSNETWVDTSGGIHQLNSSAPNFLQGATTIGVFNAFQPPIVQSGYVLQTNGPNTAYQPITLGGGHAGSLNVIATPTIGAPQVQNFAGTGVSTISYVCSGTDFDGNLINGTTYTTATGLASGAWTFPLFYNVSCPWTAGVNTYQIYRTAGGQNQGLLASGIGPGFGVADFNGSATAGSPPVSNASNPTMKVSGTGNPCITMGVAGATTTICSAAGAPATTCGTQPTGSGSFYMRTDGGASTSLYSCAGATWTAVTVP